MMLVAQKKSELLLLGKHLNLENKTAMLKYETRKIIVRHLVDEEIFDDDALELVEILGLML
jgi:hypothetical protein